MTVALWSTCTDFQHRPTTDSLGDIWRFFGWLAGYFCVGCHKNWTTFSSA